MFHLFPGRPRSPVSRHCDEVTTIIGELHAGDDFCKQSRKAALAFGVQDRVGRGRPGRGCRAARYTNLNDQTSWQHIRLSRSRSVRCFCQSSSWPGRCLRGPRGPAGKRTQVPLSLPASSLRGPALCRTPQWEIMPHSLHHSARQERDSCSCLTGEGSGQSC